MTLIKSTLQNQNPSVNDWIRAVNKLVEIIKCNEEEIKNLKAKLRAFETPIQNTNFKVIKFR